MLSFMHTTYLIGFGRTNFMNKVKHIHKCLQDQGHKLYCAQKAVFTRSALYRNWVGVVESLLILLLSLFMLPSNVAGSDSMCSRNMQEETQISQCKMKLITLIMSGD